MLGIIQNPIINSEFVFAAPPSPSCHASTIVQSTAGTLICAWFGGSREGAHDVGIYLSRQVEGKWSDPQEVAVATDRLGHQLPCWNPVLFQVSHGHLLLFYKAGVSIPHWKGFFKESDDDGVHWSTEHALPNGILGPIKNKPVQLSTGRILSGSSEEGGGWRVHFEYSDDGARTWGRTRAVNAPGVISAIQPSILEQADGSVLAIGRTQQGKLFRITSRDHGTTWGRMSLIDVDNPNAGIDAVRLSTGEFLLAFNNSTTKRTPLNLAMSSDGIQWEPVQTLESEPGEYSYPAIIETSDGLVHVTYTWQRKKIKHVTVDPRQLSIVGK